MKGLPLADRRRLRRRTAVLLLTVTTALALTAGVAQLAAASSAPLPRLGLSWSVVKRRCWTATTRIRVRRHGKLRIEKRRLRKCGPRPVRVHGRVLHLAWRQHGELFGRLTLSGKPIAGAPVTIALDDPELAKRHRDRDHRPQGALLRLHARPVEDRHGQLPVRAGRRDRDQPPDRRARLALAARRTADRRPPRPLLRRARRRTTSPATSTSSSGTGPAPPAGSPSRTSRSSTRGPAAGPRTSRSRPPPPAQSFPTELPTTWPTRSAEKSSYGKPSRRSDRSSDTRDEGRPCDPYDRVSRTT